MGAESENAVSAEYEVTIVKFGTRQAFKSDVYLNWSIYGRPDEPIGMDYYFWVIRNDVRTVVVDTGFSEAGGRRRNRTFLVRPLDALAALGIAPADAPTLIVTHAHYDHIGNLHEFRNAQVVMARSEYDFWTSHLAGRRQFSFVSEPVEIEALRRVSNDGRLTTFEDEIQVAPGIRMLRIGGHTPGQSIVLVDTAEGTVVLASDAVHYYEEYEGDVPFAFTADLPATYLGFDRIRRLVDRGEVRHIVSGHDPDTLARFTPVEHGQLAGLAATIGRR